MAGLGWPSMAMAVLDHGWPWLAWLAMIGWPWLALAGLGWPCMAIADLNWLATWLAMAGHGWPWLAPTIFRNKMEIHKSNMTDQQVRR